MNLDRAGSYLTFAVSKNLTVNYSLRIDVYYIGLRGQSHRREWRLVLYVYFFFSSVKEWQVKRLTNPQAETFLSRERGI